MRSTIPSLPVTLSILGMDGGATMLTVSGGGGLSDPNSAAAMEFTILWPLAALDCYKIRSYTIMVMAQLICLNSFKFKFILRS